MVSVYARAWAVMVQQPRQLSPLDRLQLLQVRALYPVLSLVYVLVRWL